MIHFSYRNIYLPFCHIIKKRRAFLNEFAINWLKGGEYAEITAPASTALKNKLLRLKEERPDEVTHVIENKDGSMVCHVPVRWIRVSPPRKVSEEQREAARQRFAEIRERMRSGEIDDMVINDEDICDAVEELEI